MVQAFRAGRVLVAIFAALTALKEVVTGSLVRNQDPLLLVFVAFLCTTALFAVLRRAHGGAKRPRLRDRLWEVLAINVATLLGWGTVYFALIHLAPAVVSTLAVATLPLFSTILFRALSGAQPTGRVDLVASIALGLAALWLTATAWQGGGAVGAPTSRELALAFGACVLSGLGMAASNIVSARLYAAGWQPRDVLAHRFVLLMLFAAALWLAQGNALASLDAGRVVVAALYGLAAIAFPLFVLQTGLKRSSPVEAGAIISLSPMLVLVFQSADPQVSMSAGVAVCVALTVGIVVAHILVRDTILRAGAARQPGGAA